MNKSTTSVILSYLAIICHVSHAFIPSFKPWKPLTFSPALTSPSSSSNPFLLWSVSDNSTGLIKNDDGESSNQGKGVTSVLDVLDEQELEQLTKKKDDEINKLLQKTEQKETSINRLKFQLNEYKNVVEESENLRTDAEKKVEDLTKETETIRKENKNLFDEFKAQFRKEKDDLTTKLTNRNNQLSKFKISSQEELEKVQKGAEEEQQKLVDEIKYLQKALEDTTNMIDKVKDDMNVASDSFEVKVLNQKWIIDKKEETIKNLVQEKDDMENNMGMLQTQLDELSLALEESKQQKADVENQLKQMQEENQIFKETEQEQITQLKGKFDSEKEGLLEQIKLYSDEVDEIKSKSKQEIQLAKDEETEKRLGLEIKITALQSDLNSAAERLERASKSVYEVRKAADLKVNQIKEETAKYKARLRNIDSQQKREYKRKVWDLESKVESVKYDLIKARKETIQLKATVSTLEDQIKTLKTQYETDLDAIEQKLVTEQDNASKFQLQAGQRMRSLVSKFQRRMIRREMKSMTNIELARKDLIERFGIVDPSKQSTTTMTTTLDATMFDLMATIEDASTKMKDTENEFNTKILEMESNMRDTAVKMKEEHEKELQFQKKNAEMKIIELEQTNNIEIKRAIENGKREVSSLRVVMNQKLNELKHEEKLLQETLDERNSLIEEYELERSSYRKLVKCLWLATKKKVFRSKKV